MNSITKDRFKRLAQFLFTVLCIVVITLLLTGCAPKQGYIIEKDYDSAYFIYHPSTTSCSGKPVICRTTPGYQQYVPENFGIKIEAANGDTGWRSVSEKTYAKIEIGDYYDNGMITHSE